MPEYRQKVFISPVLPIQLGITSKKQEFKYGHFKFPTAGQDRPSERK